MSGVDLVFPRPGPLLPATAVGMSIDGPRAANDAYRLDKSGRTTFDRVTRRQDRLTAHGVRWNRAAWVRRGLDRATVQTSNSTRGFVMAWCRRRDERRAGFDEGRSDAVAT